jgi:hypothetical protein
MSEKWKSKYLKYKQKYLELKKNIDGGYFYCPPKTNENYYSHNAAIGELQDVSHDGEMFTEPNTIQATPIPLDNTCPICLVNFANIKFKPCCHRVCKTCYTTANLTDCPKCRAPIKNILKLYLDGQNKDKGKWAAM